MLPPPSPLPQELRREILSYVRLTLEAILSQKATPEAPSSLKEIGGCGAFVSLHKQAQLRGCIGMVESNFPLGATLARCAIGAALEDRRFRPMELGELSKVAIEVSLLSPMAPAKPDEIEPGRHGVLIRKDNFSGLLLPQVAEKYRWTRERFLDETCRKAGLPPGAWRQPDATLLAFTAEVFSE